jgi:hypothetical protein
LVVDYGGDWDCAESPWVEVSFGSVAEYGVAGVGSADPYADDGSVAGFGEVAGDGSFAFGAVLGADDY